VVLAGEQVFAPALVALHLFGFGYGCHFDVDLRSVLLLEVDCLGHVFGEVLEVEGVEADLLQVEGLLLLEVDLD